MSQQAVHYILNRAVRNAGFRTLLSTRPDKVLARFDLSEDERVAISSLQSTHVFGSMPRSPCAEEHRAGVLLVSMPFAAHNQPSAALGLLKAVLAENGLRADVYYPLLAFARLVGVDAYRRFFMEAPKQSLLHDWVFSGCLFRDHTSRQLQYIEHLKRLKAEEWMDWDIAWVLEEAMRMRSLASEFIDDIFRQTRWEHCALIGFTITYQQTVASLALARRIKERYPDKVIVLGGACCAGPMGVELHRQFPFVDFVFTSEAETVFPTLVRRVLEGRSVGALPGVVRRRLGKTVPPSEVHTLNHNLDGLPYPDYSSYFAQLEAVEMDAQVRPRIPIETSRGCWWGQRSQCTFCGYNAGSIAYRSKSASRALDEILGLDEAFGCPMEATDSMLAASYFSDVLPALAMAGPPTCLYYQTTARLSRAQLETLREAGVWRIQPGIESLSTPVLRLIRKGTRALQNVQLLKWCTELGITCTWLLLYGFPGEDEGEYERMAQRVPALAHLEPPVRCQSVRLERFSPYHNQSARYGLSNVRPGIAYDYIYPFDADSLQRLAYYFDFDYSDERNLDYAKPLIEAVRAWQGLAGDYGLNATALDDRLFIWDLRPGSGRYLTMLTGIRRRVYEMCDQIVHLRKIEAEVFNRGRDETAGGFDLDRFLHEMCRDRLMLNEGTAYLSLAIPVDAAANELPRT